MIFIFRSLFICSFLNFQALASLILCPTSTTISTSIRYDMTISSPGIMSYSGTLLLSSNGNFVVLITIPDTGSPQSAIQGTWSSSPCGTLLTLTAHTLYFLNFPRLSVNNLTCTYTCGANNDVLRRCTAVYTTKTLKATGEYAFMFDLTISE
ncbi:hypothetical protein I4U23_026242 [Adineta vaga]|nr:hypothetical protein I4U23_026242 [Adineta vaga]